MSEALKPCPFCGNPEPSFERMGTSGQSCIVACGNCGCRHESGDEYLNSGRSWNDRSDPSPAAHGATTRETAWQPIETAPKDGTRIMLGIAGVSVYPAADLYLLATWDGICSHPYVPNTWTHWMPLPEGPDAARKVTPPSVQQEGARS